MDYKILQINEGDLMNILFLSMGRLNSIKENGLYTDLLRKFRDKGHNLYIASPLEKRHGVQTNIYIEEGVAFLRVKTGKLKNINLIRKGMSTITLENFFKRNFICQIKLEII